MFFTTLQPFTAVAGRDIAAYAYVFMSEHCYAYLLVGSQLCNTCAHSSCRAPPGRNTSNPSEAHPKGCTATASKLSAQSPSLCLQVAHMAINSHGMHPACTQPGTKCTCTQLGWRLGHSPCVLYASMAYSEHVGRNRHDAGSRGEIAPL
jgi:hypothetical protein